MQGKLSMRRRSRHDMVDFARQIDDRVRSLGGATAIVSTVERQIEDAMLMGAICGAEKLVGYCRVIKTGNYRRGQ